MTNNPQTPDLTITHSRLTNLKTAAKEFADTVLTDANEGKVSISLVPYSGHVNVGTNLFSREYPRVCVWGLAHAVETGHLLNRSG